MWALSIESDGEVVREKARAFSTRPLCLGYVKGFRPLLWPGQLVIGYVLSKGGHNPTYFFFFLNKFSPRCGPWITEKIEQRWTEVLMPKSYEMVIVV